MVYIHPIPGSYELLKAVPYVSDEFFRKMRIESEQLRFISGSQGTAKDSFSHKALPRASLEIMIQFDPCFGKTNEIKRHRVVKKKSDSLFEESSEIHSYREALHQVHAIGGAALEGESRNQYFVLDHSDEKDEKSEEKESGDIAGFLTRETSSWQGHLFRFCFSSERFHHFSAALLRFILPMIFRH